MGLPRLLLQAVARSFVGSFSLSKLPYKPFKGIGTRQEGEGERERQAKQAGGQPAVKEELVASRSLARSLAAVRPAAAAAAKIRYQMGERDRQTDLNGAIRHLLACDADKSGDRHCKTPEHSAL